MDLSTPVQGKFLGSRVARLHATHSYRTVLGLILATVLFAGLAGNGAWTSSALLLLECATLVAAVWTSGLARPGRRIIPPIVIASVVSAVLLPLTNRPTVIGAAALAAGLLVVATITTVAIGVIDQGDVNAQSVTGAICIYLLIGLLFQYFYSATALIGSGDFFAQGTDGTRAIRIYFSYVTIATLGYGDYTPAGDLGRTLAVLEALLGQIYLVTVVALLVSRVRGPRMPPTQ